MDVCLFTAKCLKCIRLHRMWRVQVSVSIPENRTLVRLNDHVLVPLPLHVVSTPAKVVFNNFHLPFIEYPDLIN